MQQAVLRLLNEQLNWPVSHKLQWSAIVNITIRLLQNKSIVAPNVEPKTKTKQFYILNTKSYNRMYLMCSGI